MVGEEESSVFIIPEVVFRWWILAHRRGRGGEKKMSGKVDGSGAGNGGNDGGRGVIGVKY